MTQKRKRKREKETDCEKRASKTVQTFVKRYRSKDQGGTSESHAVLQSMHLPHIVQLH